EPAAAQTEPEPEPQASAAQPQASAGRPEPAAQENGDGRTFVSPVVARMVSEHGLDIGAIPGTGRGGRVTKKDVQQFIDSGGTAAPAQAPEVHDVPHFAPPPEAPETAAPAAPVVEVAAPGQAGPGEELYRFNTIRKVIARHMRHSLETAAQVTTVIEV